MKKTYTTPCCTVVVLGAKENLMQPSLVTEKTASRDIHLNDPYSGGGSGYARETVRSRDVWAEEW